MALFLLDLIIILLVSGCSNVPAPPDKLPPKQPGLSLGDGDTSDNGVFHLSTSWVGGLKKDEKNTLKLVFRNAEGSEPKKTEILGIQKVHEKLKNKDVKDKHIGKISESEFDITGIDFPISGKWIFEITAKLDGESDTISVHANIADKIFFTPKDSFSTKNNLFRFKIDWENELTSNSLLNAQIKFADKSYVRVSDISIDMFDPRLPSSNNESSDTSLLKFSEVESGIIKAEGIWFHKPGNWRIYMDITVGEASDSAVFELEVP